MKGKKHNSIIFLTTLSVYLGLVLVGATPQVLAQAALTPVFDIRTEIEFEDDLDKNPDENALKTYSDAFQKLVLLAKEFSERNRTALGDGKYEFDCSFILRANDASRTSCENDLFWSEFVTPFREIVKAFPDVSDENAEQTARFSLTISGAEIVLKTALNLESKTKAGEVSNFYENVLSVSKTEKFADAQKTIYENTDFSARNNQVLIVTRLPRASIDAIAADKNAR